MQEWEYTTFQTDGAVVTALEGTTFGNNAPSEQHELEDFGSKGWELVAVTLANAGFYKFFFKRPKESLRKNLRTKLENRRGI